MNRRPFSIAPAARLSALFTLVVALGGIAFASPAGAATTEIDDGSLSWGVRESWRNYAGNGTVTEGATVNPDGTYDFPVSSGSFDDETETTILEFDGRVQWRSYPDFLGPGKWGLDTTFTDLRLEIGPTAQVLKGTHIGYLRSDPGGTLHVDEDVVLAKLRIETATTSFDAGTSSWSGIAALAGSGFSLYPEGTVIDPLSFEYSGPGGVPDLGEHFEQPGQVVLEPEGRWVTTKTALSQTQQARDVFARGSAGVVHIAEAHAIGTAAGTVTIAAHDPVTLAPIGTPLTVTYEKNQGQYFKFGFDAETDTFYYVTGRDGAGFNEQTVRLARWNPTTEGYDQEVIGKLTNSTGNIVGSVVWNPVREEVGIVATTLSSSGFNHIADLYTFRESAGSWESDQRPIVVPEAGPLTGLTAKLPSFFGTVSQLDRHSLAVARDGSYIQAPGSAVVTVGSGEKVPIPAMRIEPAWEASPEVTLLWETQLPEIPDSTYFAWAATSVGADGSVLLNGVGSRVERYVRVDIDENDDVVVDPIVEAPQGQLESGNSFADSMASDPVRGWEWATDRRDPDGYVLNTLVDDELVSRFAYPEFVSPTYGFPAIDVGHDSAVYLPIKDKTTERYGYQRLAIAGVMPGFDAQPQSAQVLLGVDEASEPASFTSTVSGGEPAVERQWQVRQAGESSFVDLAGETGATLTVDAGRAMNGNRYRAVYSNQVGRVASEEATLTVEYAPVPVSQPKSAAVTEGADAVFLVSADGNPEPTVQWQRRIDGYWYDIAPDDENFLVNGPSLTVLDTNVEQSGSMFRARLTNAAGTVKSSEARLTVTPKVTIPAEGLDLEDVSLEWTGSAEMQKVPFSGGSNFFSAGTSDGEEATYDAFADNAAVYQVSSTGVETLAGWATRADHVSNGGEQLVRLYGGDARIEPDGSTIVQWDGSWSVNFYGGLVPFTLSDPELVVEADGTGALSAEMSGCESSQVNPNECTPFAPVPDVTVATFSGAEIDPAGTVEIAPDYGGVEVDVPVPFVQQNRTAAGWGAWPQSFVDFQVKTGLSSHWYSSGGAFDPDKPPSPFAVDFSGEGLPAEPEPKPEPKAADAGPKAPASDGPTGEPALISAAGKSQPLGRKRVAKVARLACPADGFCAVIVPRRVKLRIARRAYRAKVIAPRILEAGDTAVVKVKLSRAALRKLGRRRAKGRLVVVVRSQSETTRRVIVLRVRKGGKGKRGKQGGGPVGVDGPSSGPISAEPPLLARPASAVDVSGVKVSWAPRDSWVRYASSGVAAGDGILLSNGAVGTNSTASPCPDRTSESDAQLPYSIEFAPQASWYDPASGVAGIYGQGSVTFRWAAHSIDLTASDPEIEINGASSRAIFRFSGSGGTAYPDQRASLVSLDLSGKPTVSGDGKTLAYDLMRATLTPDGVNVFAGFYNPPDNDEFGCVSVEFTLP